MLSLNYLDYAFLALLFITVILGAVRGVLKETIAVVTWLAAFVIATKYYLMLATCLEQHYGARLSISTHQELHVAVNVSSYLILFVATLIVGTILALLLRPLCTITGFGLVQRIAGASLGGCCGLLIISYIVFFANYTMFIKNPLWLHSQVVLYVRPLVNCLQLVANPDIPSAAVTQVNINKPNNASIPKNQ